MIASAAGLNTFDDRERITYLLSTAATDTIVVTYHGSCGRRTIAVIIAVRTAPLGKSRRISTSTSPATKTALSKPGAMVRMPSCVAAIAIQIERMTINSPFGVRKNRPAPWMSRRIARSPGLEALKFGTEDQPFHPHPMQKVDALHRTEHERRRSERIGEHCGRRDHSGAGDRGCGVSIQGVEYMTGLLVVSRGADRLVARGQRVDQLAVAARVPDADRPRRAFGLRPPRYRSPPASIAKSAKGCSSRPAVSM